MAASPGGMTRAPTDGQLRLITRVARMYHERGIRQAEGSIAGLRATSSRARWGRVPSTAALIHRRGETVPVRA